MQFMMSIANSVLNKWPALIILHQAKTPRGGGRKGRGGGDANVILSKSSEKSQSLLRNSLQSSIAQFPLTDKIRLRIYIHWSWKLCRDSLWWTLPFMNLIICNVFINLKDVNSELSTPSNDLNDRVSRVTDMCIWLSVDRQGSNFQILETVECFRGASTTECWGYCPHDLWQHDDVWSSHLLRFVEFNTFLIS